MLDARACPECGAMMIHIPAPSRPPENAWICARILELVEERYPKGDCRPITHADLAEPR